MADGIYVSMCGAVARSDQLDSVADNLANAQTPGFKASRPAFESFLAPKGSADKTYPAAVATQFDLRAGPTAHSGNALDIVPEDGAFLAVETTSGRAYTRDGRLSIDGQNRLVLNGHPVLSRGGSPIQVPPGTPPQISSSGTISAGGVTIGELGLFQIQGNVDRVGQSLYTLGRGGQAQAVTAGRIRSGEVEMGNATPLDGMVQLISAQRHFDASMQALQTYRSLDQRSAEVGKIR